MIFGCLSATRSKDSARLPVTAILGSRQSGKTTLARTFAAQHFFDLGNPTDHAMLADVGEAHWRRLWQRGGLPPSFTVRDDAQSRRWRDQYVATFLERDLPQLGITIPAATLRRFWTMLCHDHGQVVNHAEFARSFGVSDMTVRRYLDILAGTFMVRPLQPWHANLGKRLVKR